MSMYMYNFNKFCITAIKEYSKEIVYIIVINKELLN